MVRDDPADVGAVGAWAVEGTTELIELGSGTEYVGDGSSVTVEVHSDDAGGALDGRNVVGLIATLTYDEDETSDDLGCAAPGASNAEPDTIAGLLTRGDLSAQGEGQNSDASTSSHDVRVLWIDEALLNGGELNMTKADAQAAISGGTVGFGPTTLDLSVTVQQGGAAFCNHQDDGEEVRWTISALVFDATLAAA